MAKKKRLVGLIGLLILIVILVVMTCTSPNKQDFERNIPKEFKELKTRIEKKPVYLDYKVISGYYQIKKLSSVEAKRVEYIGIFGKVIEVEEGGATEFIFDCMKWLPSLLEGAKITILLTILS